MAFFITVPMSFMVGEPISAIAAFTPATISRFAGGFGQIAFDQDDFGGFFVGHFLASAFGELLDGFFALLDQRGQHGLRFFLVERRHFFDLLICSALFTMRSVERRAPLSPSWR